MSSEWTVLQRMRGPAVLDRPLTIYDSPLTTDDLRCQARRALRFVDPLCARL